MQASEGLKKVAAMGSAANAIRFMRKTGIRAFAKELRRRAYSAYWERRLNVATADLDSSQMQEHRTDAKEYFPIGYEHVFWALSRIPFPEQEIVFVDFGAGRGRAVAAAASRRFKRVIGVEFDQKLVEAARKNIAGMKARKAGEVLIHAGDAMEFMLPDDANVIYFFNPFEGETLACVTAKLKAFQAEKQRELFVIFFNHKHFEHLVRNEKWITTLEVREFYPSTSCALYRVRGTGTSTFGV